MTPTCYMLVLCLTLASVTAQDTAAELQSEVTTVQSDAAEAELEAASRAPPPPPRLVMVRPLRNTTRDAGG